MKQNYILFIVLNNVKKTSGLIKKLKKIGINRFTAMNTFGSQRFCSDTSQGYEPIVAGSAKSTMGHIKRKYNKTFFIALESEEEATRVMDEVEGLLNIHTDKPGDGIMFTIPMWTSSGIREQEEK